MEDICTVANRYPQFTREQLLGIREAIMRGDLFQKIANDHNCKYNTVKNLRMAMCLPPALRSRKRHTLQKCYVVYNIDHTLQAKAKRKAKYAGQSFAQYVRELIEKDLA